MRQWLLSCRQIQPTKQNSLRAKIPSPHLCNHHTHTHKHPQLWLVLLAPATLSVVFSLRKGVDNTPVRKRHYVR